MNLRYAEFMLSMKRLQKKYPEVTKADAAAAWEQATTANKEEAQGAKSNA